VTDRDEVACPACSETILATAKKCRFCGEWRDASNATADKRPPKSSKARQFALLFWLGFLIVVVGSEFLQADFLLRLRPAMPFLFQLGFIATVLHFLIVRPLKKRKNRNATDGTGKSAPVGASKGMEVAGIGLMGLAAVLMLYSLNMSTTVTTDARDFGFGVRVPSMTVNNIGLMQDKQNMLIVSGFVGLLGLGLFVSGKKG